MSEQQDEPKGNENGEGLADRLEAQALASIQQKAEGGTAGNSEEPAKEQTQRQARSAAQEWADVYYTFGELAGVRFPRLREVYTQERCLAVQEKLDPIFERRGWNNIEAMGTAMQYLMGAVAVLMLGKDTAQAIKADLEDEAVKAAKEVKTDGS